LKVGIFYILNYKMYSSRKKKQTKCFSSERNKVEQPIVVRWPIMSNSRHLGNDPIKFFFNVRFWPQFMSCMIVMEWLVTSSLGTSNFLVWIHCKNWLIRLSMLENILTTLGEQNEHYGFKFRVVSKLWGHDVSNPSKIHSKFILCQKKT